MRHVDPHRKRGLYCNTQCFLCAQAALMTLRGLKLGAAAILKPSGPEVKLPKFKPGQLGGIVSGFWRRVRKDRSQHQ